MDLVPIGSGSSPVVHYSEHSNGVRYGSSCRFIERWRLHAVISEVGKASDA
jgi:hypothetical protein